ncbi:MAG: hypothetical protein QF893_17800 [Alphaproteobacteria bacterium]|jgi:hypothetical protein|nr:hypothetical protein [Alphaproteobacteria bacterium]
MSTDELPPIDAASLIALPAERPTLDRHSREVATAEALSDEVLGGEPLLTHVWSSDYGRVGTILIPVVDMQLFQDRGKTVEAARKGVQLAISAGARCVSFTGMIPAATGYAQDIADGVRGSEPADAADGSPGLTSGHAAVVAAFAFNVESILAAADRAYDDESVVFVGIGSIGEGILRLLDARFSPRKVYVVDIHQKRDRLVQVCTELRGEVEAITIEKGDSLPEWLYDRCSLFLSATSTPLVIDIDRLPPGALLVDDSFPFGFDTERAAARLDRDSDIRITIAGGLQGTAPFELAHVTAPPGREGEFQVLLDRMAKIINPWPRCMTGCIYSSLLTSHFDLPETLGPVTYGHAEKFYRKLKSEGFAGTPPHMITFDPVYREAIHVMPEAALERPSRA